MSTLRVSRKNRRDRATRKFSPGVGGRTVELAVFATLASTPRCSYREYIAIGSGRLGLIATGDVQVLGEFSDGFLYNSGDAMGNRREGYTYCQCNPIISRLDISTRGRIGVSPNSNDSSSEVQ